MFFGDTHLHTSYSTDAGMIGNTLGPDEAYRFARGETVTSSTGLRARLQRPLDFLVVADHAENLGLAPVIAESNPELLKNEWGEMGTTSSSRRHRAVKAYDDWMARDWKRQDPLKEQDRVGRSMWANVTAAAEKYNEPGRFTAFIGFEWTSLPDGETIFTATSSSATARTRRTRSSHSRSMTARSGGTVEVDGRIRAEDRRPAAGDPAQRQSLQWHDVRRRHA